MPLVHGQSSPGWLRGFWRDVRYAARMMKRQPWFAATIVVTLGLGIAVNSTVFTIVNAVALRPMPFQDADRIVQLNVRNLGNAQNPVSELSYPDFQEWQTARRTFEQIAATEERAVDIADEQRAPAVVRAAYVSWNTFSLIGQPPALGRDFTASDDRIGAPPAVILGGTLWRARFGADPTTIGKTIRVNGVPSTIVGIMPPEVGFPDRVEFWLPLVACRTRNERHAVHAYSTASDAYGPGSPSSRPRQSSMASRPRSPSATRIRTGTPLHWWSSSVSPRHSWRY
jgi:putative ABC transport system permease protein